jgi:sugar phosphate isomerase/epimerase
MHSQTIGGTMENHWSSYLTLSVVHFMAYPETMLGEGPVVETVRKVAEDEFFGGIELTWMKDPTVRKQVRALLECAHLPAAFGAQPTLLSQKLDLNSADPDMRGRAVAQLKQDIEYAADLGISRMSTLSGIDPGDKARADALCWLVDSLSEVCRYGQAHAVSLCVETFDRTVDKKALIGPAGESAAFSAEMRRAFPDFGLMYDLSHQPLLEEDMLLALHTLKDQLVHAHVGNCVKVPGRPGYGDQHPRFGFPGGENDVDQLVDFLRGLFAVGYLKKTPDGRKPWVGIEVKPQPGESSDLVLSGTKRVWIEAWARV